MLLRMQQTYMLFLVSVCHQCRAAHQLFDAEPWNGHRHQPRRSGISTCGGWQAAASIQGPEKLYEEAITTSEAKADTTVIPTVSGGITDHCECCCTGQQPHYYHIISKQSSRENTLLPQISLTNLQSSCEKKTWVTNENRLLPWIFFFLSQCTVHSYKFAQQGKRLQLPTNGTQTVLH